MVRHVMWWRSSTLIKQQKFEKWQAPFGSSKDKIDVQLEKSIPDLVHVAPVLGGVAVLPI